MKERARAWAAVALGIIVLSLFGIGYSWRNPSALAPPIPETRAPEQPLAAPSPPHGIEPSEKFTTDSPATKEPSKVHPDIAAIHVSSIATPSDAQIEAIVRRGDLPDSLKVLALIQMLPGLPEEALARAAEEAVGRLPDADYAAVLLPVVLDPGTHGAAMSVLFADLMERPDTITLPALLAIARNSAHPYASSAQNNLCLLLGADFGSDWPRWETELRQRLRVPP